MGMTMRDQMDRSEENRSKSWVLNLPEGVEMFKLDADKKYIYIDLIPFIAGKDNPDADKGKPAFFRTFWVHKNIGPNGVTVMCPAKNSVDGEFSECCICAAAKKLFDKAGGDEDSREYAKAVKLSAKTRNLFNIIDRESDEKKIQIWDVAPSLFFDVLKDRDSELEPGSKKISYAEPHKGYTLKCKVKKKKWKKFTYGEITSVDFVKRKKQYKKSLKKESPCLDDVVKKPMSAKKLAKIFLQASSDSKEEDNDSSDNKGKKDKKMKTRKINAKKKGIKKGSKCEHDELGTVTVLSLNRKGTTATVKDNEDDEHDVGVGELEVSKGKKKDAKKDKKSKKKDTKKGKKAAAKKGKKGKKKSKEEDDDDDEDEDEDEDEEEEEDDDDDSDDDDDDDEDDDSDDDDDDDSDDDEEDDDDDDDEDEDD